MSLITVDELAARATEASLRVIDTRWYLLRPGAGRDAYEAGHIPSAIFLDLSADLSATDGPGRHPLPTPAEFSARMAAVGVGDDSTVVVYDDAGGTVAARLWWMLDNLGFADVHVLDGGIGAWTAAGLPLEVGTASDVAHPPATLTLAPAWRNTLDRGELTRRLGDVTLLDARAPERYRGEVEPIDPVAGHIPSAVNAPTAANLGADGRFLPGEQLRTRYEALTADGSTTVMSCGSGTTACHNILAMRLAGMPDPLLYPGSYSEWSSAGLPVVAGDAPGAPETGG